jgi:NodT family efflux transporter outer membrane factor (OMF) lipoprotein
MVGPDYKAPEVKVNPAFTEIHPTSQPISTVTTISTAPVAWWTTFRDPELESLIHRAARGNYTLQEAASRVRQARDQRGITGSDLLPQLNVGGGYDRSHGSKNVTIPASAFGITVPSSKTATNTGKLTVPAEQSTKSRLLPSITHLGGPQSAFGSGGGLPGVTTDLYEAGFDSSWEIDVFGGQRRAVEGAIDDIQAAQEDQRDTLITLLAEIARTYIELRGYQRQFAIANQNLDSQRQTLDLTTSRFKAGFVTDLDVARQATQVSTTAASLPALDAQIHISIHKLGVLLGEDPSALLTELTTTKPIPAVPPEIPIGLPSDLLRRRPDIRRAERQMASANAGIGQAVADLFPKFSITAALGFDTNKPKYLADWNSKYWALSPGVSWPIFDAGRIRFNIKAANEKEAQAADKYQQTVLTALQEVEDSLTSYRTEQLRHQALADAVTAARLAVDLAKQQYDQGITDFLSVLEAQRDEFGTEDSLAQSDRNISTDLVAVYKALGGGWEVMLPEPHQD